MDVRLRYKCLFKGCNKECTESNRDDHYVTHFPKKFKCEICFKKFHLSSGLYQHKRTHWPKSDELYDCPECNKKFKSEQGILRHRELHREKTFQCTHCPKLFATASRLKKHEKYYKGQLSPRTYHFFETGESYTMAEWKEEFSSDDEIIEEGLTFNDPDLDCFV
jgi:hypothetical protein